MKNTCNALEKLYCAKYNLIYLFINDHAARYEISQSDREEISQNVWAKVILHTEKILSMDDYHVTNYLRIMVLITPQVELKDYW